MLGDMFSDAHAGLQDNLEYYIKLFPGGYNEIIPDLERFLNEMDELRERIDQLEYEKELGRVKWSVRRRKL